MKKRLIAGVSAVAMLASCVPAMAQYEAFSGPDADGMTLGHYTDEFKAEDRAETEKLYQSRPKNERRFEALTRGLVAVPGEGGTLVSWRFLGTDSNDLCYNLYRNGEKLNNEPLNASSYFDIDAPAGAKYILTEVVNGSENGTSTETTAWSNNYISFKVTERAGYNIDDGAVGDLDGDGEYEILLRRIPSMDTTKERTDYPLIEAYKTDGTHMWTIDIGPNEINEHDINMMVYDFNGDGKSEVVMRSFEGTIDGAGNKVGDVNGDGITDYTKNPDNLAIFQDRQYVVSTPEFLSVYDGETGAELDRTDLLPAKEPLSGWSYRYTDTGRLTKRASHFLFGLAYLDGVTPAVVMVRGAWDNVGAAAWHLEDNKFVTDWEFMSPNEDNPDTIWGAWNHNMIVADVDFDGKDEILSGPAAIDNDGSEMYATKAYDNDGKPQKLLHGDAFDVAKMDPDFNGYLVWACHENSALMANTDLHDARTGQVTWGYGKNKDTGRSRSGDIDPTYKGHEVWASTAQIPSSFTGETIVDEWNTIDFRNPDGSVALTGSLPVNFKVYWDGDLLSEFLDGVTVSKWNWEDKTVDILMEATGCASNSGTKAVPCAAADLFGDWRDEIVWKTTDETEIRIYSTAIPTSYKIPTLMHDSLYRASIAMQNNHYNQPANVSYYLGAETKEIPIFEGYTVVDGQKVTNPDLAGSHGTYTIGNGSIGTFTMKLLIDSPYAMVGNDIVKIDETDDKVTPIIIDERTLVPVRFIAESLGMTVGWNEDTREVSLEGNGYTVKMTLDKAEYTVNGKPYTLDVPAAAINERTMIPLRAMAEAVGMQVEWDGERQLIYLGKHAFYDVDESDRYVTGLKTGTLPEPTAAPTEEPTEDPSLTAEYTEYTDSNGKRWNIYVNEDFESYSVGDTAGWEGTKPAPLDNIGVITSGSSKVMGISGSSKGNRNAVYTAPFGVSGTVLIELDWKPGTCEGGTSYGEIRFSDDSGKVFLGIRTVKGQELQYSTGGSISNGGIETEEWKNTGYKDLNAQYHITIEADFAAKKCELYMNGKKVGDIDFYNAENFGAIEVLAVRQEKNFDWATEIDNLKIGKLN
ncbi:MAG: hypothetical protein J1G06_10005 [Oscillospiraceae bacterium]|nr:hypothetical protein [Oscillospiraceae bacterium]